MTRRMGSVCETPARAAAEVLSVGAAADDAATAARARRCACAAVVPRHSATATRRNSLAFILGLRKKRVFQAHPSRPGLRVGKSRARVLQGPPGDAGAFAERSA